ncbi:MAG TPA: hypothetical protein ENJ78_01270, partial [candidate division WWE3 bacterium]|nr:hypothetical protein [candidate division WWE3 bacterium]
MPPVLDLDEGISPIEVVTGEEILQLLLNISKAGKVFTAAYNDMAEEIAGSGDFECLYVLHRHPRQNPKYANTVAFLREVGEGAVFYIIDKNGNWREPVADIIPDERGGREGLGTLSIPYEREDGSIGTEESTTYWVPDEDPLNRLLPQGTILKYLIISGKALEKIRDELIGYIEGMRQEGKT